jgi:hypothetical protein
MALRCVRGGLFALVCTGLALCGHVLAGGAAPAPVYLVAGFAGVLAAGVVALGCERGFCSIAGGLLAGQFGLHALFMSSSAGSRPMADGVAARTARLADDLLCGAGVHPSGAAADIVRRAGLGAATPAMPAMPAHMPVSAMLGLNAWMIAAHVVAACVTGGYLWFGESRLWALIRVAGHRASRWSLLRWLVSCLDTVSAEPCVRSLASVRPGRVRARRWLETRVVSWRGPPPVRVA